MLDHPHLNDVRLTLLVLIAASSCVLGCNRSSREGNVSEAVTSERPAASPGRAEAQKPHSGSQPRGLRNTNGQARREPHQVPELVISWRGFRRDGDREQVTYLVNDEPVGKGKDGFRQIVERASRAEPNTRILLPRAYFVTGRPEPCPPGYWPPYCEYQDLLEELSRVAKTRGLEIWDVGGWDEETGAGELVPGGRRVFRPNASARPGGTDKDR